MQLEELRSWIEKQPGWSFEMDDKGIVIINEDFKTMTHCTFDAVERNTRECIIANCYQGRNVDHITRVTGYFSRTSQWNAGKRAELRDRKRYILAGQAG